MRLINADKFIEKCKEIISEESDNLSCITWAFAYDNVIDEINAQPIVDAVPVVRCKDCMYCDKHTCNFWGEIVGIRVSEDGYCNNGIKGEMKTDDNY